MKKILKVVVSFVISWFFKIYDYNTHIYITKIKNVLYSSWIKNVFKKCGNNFYVASPISIKGGDYIEIGNNFTGINNLRFECWNEYLGMKFSPSLVIGNNVSMNNNIHIGCINKILIGDNVLFASNIFVTDHFHGYVDERDLNISPHFRELYSKGQVVIMDDVWIGENVTIMPNVTIGKSCVIGANSVVTNSFPDNSIIAGVPAKIIRKLN